MECLQAQKLVGGAFCASFKTETGNTGKLISRFGGCPDCSVSEGAAGTFVPPFVEDNPDCFTASFDFDFQTDDCGMVFNFFYTGNANVDEITFEWDFGETAFPQVSNLSNPMGIAFSETGAQSVVLRIFDSACDVSTATSVVVGSVGFAANPVVTDVLCRDGNNGSVRLDINGGEAPFTFMWSNGSLTDSITNLTSGDYTYTVTDASGCVSENSVTVVEPDSIQATFVSSPETCSGDLDGAANITVIGGIAPYNVEWSDGETGLNRANLASIDYTLMISDANNCVLEQSLFIDQQCNPRIFNTISPNGDGVNDTWTVTDIESFPDNELQIFNRWGSKVYNESNYNNTWGGINNDGNPLPAGAYYYVIHLNNEGNNVLTGSITIMR